MELRSSSTWEHFSSEIYCQGDLLRTVQLAKLYNDSKTFVDMKLKQPPQTTIDAFNQFMTEHNNQPTKEEIQQFVNVSDSDKCSKRSFDFFDQ